MLGSQPLGDDAVTQIHAMFDWAKTSKRGLLLFVDEAEAFLAQRQGGMSESSRNALNALLFQTGTQSHNFALVLATNRQVARLLLASGLQSYQECQQ